MKKEVAPKLLSDAVMEANKLFEKGKYPIMQEWRIGEQILEEYKEKLVGALENTDILEVCLVLNALYSTRIPPGDVVPWAKKLSEFLKKFQKGYKDEEGRKKQWEYIENELMPKEKQEKINKGILNEHVQKSFLSKFFHFFVEGGETIFPIYDSFALAALRKIQGGSEDYNKYRDKVDGLTKKAGLENNEKRYRQIDRFLWIAGHYWAKSLSKNWKKMFKDIKKDKKDNSFNEIINYLDTLFERPGWMDE